MRESIPLSKDCADESYSYRGQTSPVMAPQSPNDETEDRHL